MFGECRIKLCVEQCVEVVAGRGRRFWQLTSIACRSPCRWRVKHIALPDCLLGSDLSFYGRRRILAKREVFRSLVDLGFLGRFAFLEDLGCPALLFGFDRLRFFLGPGPSLFVLARLLCGYSLGFGGRDLFRSLAG